jgi:hypothetical protein
MAITALHESSASIGTTEFSLPNGSTTLTPITTDGVFQCFLDLSALVAGDEYLFQVYEKVQAAGTERVVWRQTFLNAQAEPHWVSPSLVLMHGWDMTLDRQAGSDRTIGWSIRQVS